MPASPRPRLLVPKLQFGNVSIVHLSSRAESRDPGEVTLKHSQRDPSTSPRFAQDDKEAEDDRNRVSEEGCGSQTRVSEPETENVYDDRIVTVMLTSSRTRQAYLRVVFLVAVGSATVAVLLNIPLGRAYFVMGALGILTSVFFFFAPFTARGRVSPSGCVLPSWWLPLRC